MAQLQVTVVAGTLSVGTAPYARLTKDGLQVYLGANDYPGKSVKAGELTASLKAVSPDATVMLIAPKGTPAQELVPAVTAINLAKRTAYLAVRAPDSPDGWDVPVALATPLETKGKNALRIADGMTVQQLAEALAKRP